MSDEKAVQGAGSGPASAASGSARGPAGGAAQADRVLETADRMLRRIVRLMDLGDQVGEAKSGLSARRVPLHPVLGYSEVVAFLVRNHAAVPQAAGGAVLRRRRGREYLVQTFFLDAEGTPLRGTGTADAPVWVCRAQRLDEELAAAFGGTDLIVFEGGA
ncbi:hypothetical protein [Streptomyces sp. ME19-01-6]|uniref:hypothetical protein n=1 Tax=Streptomyces sp. ME19-01-6 TaxID=3028686 RepID=UPI0029A4AF12|nr:hypothetical protein [Streptomyces sp. ME19-01-6]MDX3226103.1 hypothetical protein [Streptomyces sp. ME19-01-6]